MARRSCYSMVSGSGLNGSRVSVGRRSASMAVSKLPAIWPSPNTRRTCDRRCEHVAPCPCASGGRRMALRRDRLDPDRGSWSGAWRCGTRRRGRRCLRSAFFWWRGWPAGERRAKWPRSVRCVPATVRPETARRASARRGARTRTDEFGNGQALPGGGLFDQGPFGVGEADGAGTASSAAVLGGIVSTGRRHRPIDIPVPR